jgi:hypothetical protein
LLAGLFSVRSIPTSTLATDGNVVVAGCVSSEAEPVTIMSSALS